MNLQLKNYYRQELKTMAETIRRLKQTIRTNQKQGLCAARDQENLHWLRVRCRYLHLSFGLHRGRTIEIMERNPRTPHDPAKLSMYRQEFEASLAVVTSA